MRKAQERNLIGWKYVDNQTIASSRIRCINVISHLRGKIKIEKYNKKKQDKYKIVIFSKIFQDKHVKEAEDLSNKGIKIYFDICDNYFYNPENSTQKTNLQNNIKAIISLSDKIIVSSNELKNQMLENIPQIASKIHVVEDAVEDCVYHKKFDILNRVKSSISYFQYKSQLNNKNLNLVWFGNHGKIDYAGMQDLFNIKEILEELNLKHKINLTIVSSNKEYYEEHISSWQIQTHYLDWNPFNFDSILKLNDASLIPITKNPFTICKTNNRIIQSVKCGLDVLADEIESYKEFSNCCFIENWKKGLKEVLASKSTSNNKIARLKSANEIINKNYSIDLISNKWKLLLN